MLYYAGKMSGGEKTKENLRDVSEAEPQYIFMVPACRDRSETHMVKEYLGSFEIHAKDEFFM